MTNAATYAYYDYATLVTDLDNLLPHDYGQGLTKEDIAQQLGVPPWVVDKCINLHRNARDDKGKVMYDSLVTDGGPWAVYWLTSDADEAGGHRVIRRLDRKSRLETDIAMAERELRYLPARGARYRLVRDYRDDLQDEVDEQRRQAARAARLVVAGTAGAQTSGHKGP